jgi:hypothetical protein
LLRYIIDVGVIDLDFRKIIKKIIFMMLFATSGGYILLFIRKKNIINYFIKYQFYGTSCCSIIISILNYKTINKLLDNYNRGYYLSDEHEYLDLIIKNWNNILTNSEIFKMLLFILTIYFNKYDLLLEYTYIIWPLYNWIILNYFYRCH